LFREGEGRVKAGGDASSPVVTARSVAPIGRVLGFRIPISTIEH